MDKIKLLNGTFIPTLAYGTWLIKNDDAAECVKNALEVGYRHIDTAQAYGNEEGVGEGIRLSGIPREEIYITTKVQAELKNYADAKSSIDESLRKLGVDYCDLIIIHCPQPWREFRNKKKRYFKENIEVWRALEDAYNEGKVKAIGVSNFLNDDLENIINNCRIVPMVNQILTHVGNTPIDVIKYDQERGIAVEAYSPIAHGAILKSRKIKAIAAKYNVSVAQLCIKYTLQLGTISIPKASKRPHMEDNFKLDFTISEDDMTTLLKMNKVNYGVDALWPVFRNKNKA